MNFFELYVRISKKTCKNILQQFSKFFFFWDWHKLSTSYRKVHWLNQNQEYVYDWLLICSLFCVCFVHFV